MKKILLLALLLPTLASADVILRGGGTTNQAKVNTAGSLVTNEGPSMRATYVATVSGATTTAAWNIACEGSASLGMKISQFCVTVPGGATAAAGPLLWTLRRTTTAGSGGTALGADAATTTAVTRMDNGSGGFPGTCRGLASTTGTAGATIDQGSWNQSAGVNLATITFCKNYGMNGDQLPTIPAGVANGFILAVGAAGAGSLAVGAATVVLVVE
jgi:hypothetical protein